MSFWNRRTRQHGGEIVEFTISLPIILLLFFGIVEMSFGFFDQAILTNASRAAAREAIRAMPPDGDWDNWDPEADARQAARDSARSIFTWSGPAPLEDDDIVVTPDPLAAVEGTPITVTVTYPYQFHVLPAFMSGLADITLTAETVMRVLPRHPPAP